MLHEYLLHLKKSRCDVFFPIQFDTNQSVELLYLQGHYQHNQKPRLQNSTKNISRYLSDKNLKYFLLFCFIIQEKCNKTQKQKLLQSIL